MFEGADTPGSVASAAAPPARLGAPVDPRRLRRVVARASVLLAAAALAGTLAGVFFGNRMLPPEYVATTGIVWEPSNLESRDGTAGPRQLRTLADGIRLPANLEEVRRRLGLSTALRALGRRVEVESTDASNLVTLRATAASPADAARLADTVVGVFLEYAARAERARLEELARVLASSAADAEAGVTTARRESDDFRRNNGIADLPVQTQLLIEQAARLRTEADLARADAEGEQSRLTVLRSAAQASPRTTVLAESVTRPVAVRMAENEAELDRARTRLAPDHPQLLALEAQREALRARAAALGPGVTSERTFGPNPQRTALQQGLTGSDAQRQASLRRRAIYEELAAEVHGQLERLSTVGGRAADLLARVEFAETRLSERQAEHSRAADAARNATSGFRVVTPALRPERPEHSYRILVTLVLAVLAPLVALALVLAVALRGLRVHTPAEAAYWGGAPVVASSTWPRDVTALADLAADLHGDSQGAHGTTLLVPASDLEAEDTLALAKHLRASAHDDDRSRPAAGTHTIAAWEGPSAGPKLRRAARWADRLLVVVAAGRYSAPALAALRPRLGREDDVGLLLIGVAPRLADLPDRVGDARRFWAAVRPRLAGAADATRRPRVPPMAVPMG